MIPNADSTTLKRARRRKLRTIPLTRPALPIERSGRRLCPQCEDVVRETPLGPKCTSCNRLLSSAPGSNYAAGAL